MSVDVKAATLAWRDGRFAAGERPVPEEAAVAVSINGTTHAVMMATPSDLKDMALGLALNERIVRTADEIERLEMEAVDGGYDCRLWLVPQRAATYVARRRQMTGPVGCGLCGVESLEYATVSLPRLDDVLAVEPVQIVRAMEEMAEGQVLGRRTRAVHAAAFHRPGTGCIVIREDVGRHNALDKVTGHLAAAGTDASLGFLTITSRLSVELVQKSAMMGCGLIAAISVPSALALREADTAGITVVAVARGDTFEVFTHPRRIVGAVEPRP
ncbi:formate dehydrogenase accessory sulfurtransferase FdhD [Aureimonas altamirensis]|uniref:formate dehydrogenase accessory sulfurtransferase FdhD n=1 Tax=Aureimonas altamirensis TaxID=370622 RepID=UPI002036BB8F|nr:formate dehydrogenase accessory sulfurtransferase FdhD [Aureimonas altamirensis]MCM2503091.1 formate dehydrogenase accessory sulfurtransferase FdhD [Aureimonas altamirensis]